MGHLRQLLLNHRALAAMLLVLTLCLKSVVPAGYMLGSEGRVLEVKMCGESGMELSKQIVLPGSADHDSESKAAKAKDACPFAGHAAPVLGGADPVLLAQALAFVLALGFALQMVPTLPAVHGLRPPLRGPPVFS